MTSLVEIDDAPEPGDTFTLTPEGWQRVEYTEPDRGWHPRPDGSWESPDGITRTFPLDGPSALDHLSGE